MTRWLRGVLVAGVVCGVVVGIALGIRAAPRDPALFPAPTQARRVAPTAPASRSARLMSPTAPPSVTLRLEGQVLGPDGTGASGARVTLATRPPRAVTAELDGSFVFEGLAAGIHVITARTATLLGGPSVVRLSAATGPIVVRMVDGAALALRVVDGRGGSIAGARVELVDAAALIATTDAAGRARLAPLRPGEAAIVVSAAGFATTSATAVIAAGAATELTLALPAGHAVSGRVVDERGRPVEGARVAPIGGVDGVARTHAQSDAAGRFTIADLGAGTWVLGATDGEHAPAFSAPVVVADREVDGVTLTMTRGGVIRGRVADAQGQPVASAGVHVTGHDAQTRTTVSREQPTDADGRFEIRGLPRLALQIQAQAAAGISALVERDLRAPAEDATIELRLVATGTIAGVVVTPEGDPVAEVQVTAFADVDGTTPAAELAPPSPVTSDGEGAFVLAGLRPGARYAIAVVGQIAGLRNPDAPVIATTGARDVRVVLVATGGVRGRVALAGTGTAPARATVQLGREPAVPAIGGEFTLADVPPGLHDLIVTGDFARHVVRGVVVEAGRVTELPTITVDRGRTLIGTVVDARGAPVAGARVETLERDASVMTDGQGRFALSGVPARGARVAASHDTHGRSDAVVISPSAVEPAPIQLALRGTGSLAGKVTVAGGKAAPAMITLASEEDAPRFAYAGEDGGFVVADLPAGAYEVSAIPMAQPRGAEAPVPSPTTVSVRITAGARHQLTIDLR